MPPPCWNVPPEDPGCRMTNWRHHSSSGLAIWCACDMQNFGLNPLIYFEKIHSRNSLPFVYLGMSNEWNECPKPASTVISLDPVRNFDVEVISRLAKTISHLFWVHLKLPSCNSASLSRFLDNSYFYYTILNSLSSHSSRIRTIQGSLLPTLPSLLGKPNKKLKRNRKNKDTNSSAWKIRLALRVSSRNISFWVGPGTKSFIII
jgi:hypothetical protein